MSDGVGDGWFATFEDGRWLAACHFAGRVMVLEDHEGAGFDTEEEAIEFLRSQGVVLL